MSARTQSIGASGRQIPDPTPFAAVCPACHHSNRAGARFCGGCAAALEAAVSCAQCGASSPSGQRFCDACGHPLQGSRTSSPDVRHRLPPHLVDRLLAAQAALEARASPDGERKTITALFADIKGSVELMQDLDPEEARDLVDPALELMIDSVHEFEGFVDKCTGDGILALFGAPIAHEDHAQRAVFAALRIQERVARYGQKLSRERQAPLPLRIGLNSGEVVLRSIRKDDLRADYTPIGHSTNLAARLEGLATPGGVLVSENTYRLAEGYVEFRPRAVVQVKGVRAPVQTYEVVGLGTLRTRFDRSTRQGLARFVGRQAELGHLRDALELARGGRGQIVAVIGDPGIGKSRLFHEFKGAIEPDTLLLEACAVTHGRSHPYLPLIELLRACFQILAADDEETRRRKIADAVAALDPALEDTLPYLYHLLGVGALASSLEQMDARIRRRRTFDALKRLVLRESLRRPLVLVFQDLQWIDGETQAFLDLLAESLSAARLMLLVNYRPEYQHGWGRKTFYTQLPLEALAHENADALLTALIGDASDLVPVKKIISAKSEGNPFFMEEIVQALLDRAVLVRAGSRVTLTRPLASVEIPATVQGVLTARIDRLPGGEKTLLQTLAVIGRGFSFDLVARVVDLDEDELQRLLGALQAAEFVYEQLAFPEPRYTFKHALTQEVAYASLLVQRRRELHERTAQAIEALHATRLGDHYGELAHHYRASGNTVKAVEYLQLAGRQAMQRSAPTDAVDHLTAALALLETLPDDRRRTEQELAIQVTLGTALTWTKGWAAPEVGVAWKRAEALCQAVGETPQLFPVLFGVWGLKVARCELRKAEELGEQMLDLAEGVGDRALLVEAHRVMGATLFLRGDFTRARGHLETGVALYDPGAHGAHASVYGQDPGVSALSYGALVLWHLGRPDAARETAERALALAERIAHPSTMAFALDMAAAVHQFRREAGRTCALAERAVALSADQGFPHWAAFGAVLRGWALVHEHRSEAQAADLRDGLDAWRSTGSQIVGRYLLGMTAEAYGGLGDPEAGLPLLTEALVLAELMGERWWEPELHRLRGALLLQHHPDRIGDAERCFRDAVATARLHASRGLELRATTSLARLLADQGRQADAVGPLAEIYDTFSEGFDTADLVEAGTLLSALRR